MAKIYKKLPRGYYLYDVARNSKQAKALAKSYPKNMKPIIVATPSYKVFPYHIAIKKGTG